LSTTSCDRAIAFGFGKVRRTIRRREGGRESQLSTENGILTFENAQVRIRLSRDFKIKEMALQETFEGTFSLGEAADRLLQPTHAPRV
jgi:regulator of replication initiation timing